MHASDEKLASPGGSSCSSRRTAPVFVLGCPRSGTTVLYHMILSAGDFAVYRAESNVFNLLGPRFGGMKSSSDRKQLMETWRQSVLFRVSGLDGSAIENRILQECRSEGDFLRILMQSIASAQGVARWADCTPEHLLYMEEIKKQLPDALFIHIIRDGRDVALSYARQGWVHPLPWDRGRELEIAGLYWEWLVRKGREQGARLGADYCEVRYERLVAEPQEVLSNLGAFIAHDLDYQKIQSAGIGSVSRPNSSFGGDGEGTFNPVGRWKTKMSAGEIAAFENLVGDFLNELDYPLASGSVRSGSLHAARLKATYMSLFEAKHWAKTHTPLGRRTRLERIEIQPSP